MISQICESNGIDVDNIAFSIKEESVILGENAANISVSLINEGSDVFVAPTKHDELWINIGEELKSIIESSLNEVSVYWVKNKLGGVSFFPKEDKERPAKQSDVDYYAYTYSTKPNVKNIIVPYIDQNMKYNKNNYKDYEYDKGKYDNHYRDPITRRAANVGRSIRAFHRGHVGIESTKEDRISKRSSKNNSDKQNSSRNNPENKTTSYENKQNSLIAIPNTKNMNSEINKAEHSNDKNFIAKVIAKLHDWAKRYSEKYKETKISGPKTAIQKALSFITKAIASLTKRLHNLTTKYKID